PTGPQSVCCRSTTAVSQRTCRARDGGTRFVCLPCRVATRCWTSACRTRLRRRSRHAGRNARRVRGTLAVRRHWGLPFGLSVACPGDLAVQCAPLCPPAQCVETTGEWPLH